MMWRIVGLMAALTVAGGCSVVGWNDADSCEWGDVQAWVYSDVAARDQVAAGPATITEHDTTMASRRLTIRMDAGETLELRYRVGDRSLPVTVGQVVHVNFWQYQPFWAAAELVLTEPDGGLIAAVWSKNSVDSLGIPGLNLTTVTTGCSATSPPDVPTCGERVSLGLRLERAGMDPVVLEAGTEVVTDGLVVGSGSRSIRYTGEIGCTDTTQDWAEGYVIAQ